MRQHGIDDDTDPDIVADGEYIRVPMMLMDVGRGRVYLKPKPTASDAAAPTFDASLHRPGYRVGDQAAEDARAKAYDEMLARMSNAWRTPQRVEQDREVAAMVAHDAVVNADDAQKVRDAAYWRMVKRMSEEWKTRP